MDAFRLIDTSGSTGVEKDTAMGMNKSFERAASQKWRRFASQESCVSFDQHPSKDDRSKFKLYFACLRSHHWLDRLCRVAFPLAFLLFNLIYWTYAFGA